ncbi:hypothetical protein NBO_113g0001 [Nosema bombycis CQ1]|uniref:Uncharacterized protein n=1 Tax=Nosema bombycis (strain CQ1 / CVCC 102059) TaxID=578461 RepID=R0M5C3_NOSB1|nr:hypothetical protein NBO_113g0001 [Nosema bombycis CQ1]|eukprot:EOB13209.1 hypothetical protein NBO_113g0001 [Nosema bombycis CQ1]
MNFFYMIIFCLLSIKTGKHSLKIRKIKLLENDLWPVDKEQAKVYKKGYLYKVTIVFKNESFVDIGFDYYQRDCYSLGITEKQYIILNSRLSKKTTFSQEPTDHGKKFYEISLFIY